MYTLYGNGVNDDYPALQELLDSGKAEVVLPRPQKNYLISKTLKIHSNQCLRMDRETVIALAYKANCTMIENADFNNFAENICIDGGIWDMNHVNQAPNPYHFPDENGETMQDKYKMDKTARRKYISTLTAFDQRFYTGHCMRFCRIKNFTIKNLTIKNPVVYGVQMGYIEEFVVENINFDYTEGSPKLWNMDGIHIEGNCKNGVVKNLVGACHDDTVAITADDGLYGPIENILVDGIKGYGAHSAVRLLSHGVPVKNITIRNVEGSYYVYAIGLTKYHGGEDERGIMQNITIENVTACACEGTKDVMGGYYPFLWIQKGLDVENLMVNNVKREEKTFPTPFFKLDEGATVKNLTLKNLYQKNSLGLPIDFIVLDGKVDGITKDNLEG